MRFFNTNRVIGLIAMSLACVLAFVWVPSDVDTGIVERARGRYTIGDGLAPTVAAAFLAISGLMIFFERSSSADRLDRQAWRYIASMVVIGAVAIVVMRWTGPALAQLANMPDGYRLLRDTVPWKYAGFVLGGGAMVFGMVCFIERRFSWRAMWIAFAALVGIIALYDLPFDDILLPPNGDV